MAATMALAAGLVVSTVPAGGQQERPLQAAATESSELVVLLAEGADTSAAVAHLTTLGAQVESVNSQVGSVVVRTADAGFAARAAADAAVAGVARNRPIGYAPGLDQAKPADIEKLRDEDLTTAGASQSVDAAATDSDLVPSHEPLALRQWDMVMINATDDTAHARQKGDRGVLVGVIDTGIDASHPDLADHVDRALSRNFTTDIPEIDGPCEDEPDKSCSDPADVDEGGHGTHVAGIIAAGINGRGIAGVAPGVTLVNLRAGQDSGFFFLQPTLDAITYAADNGIDVVNMSFYTDPWLFNCASNPADSPAEQLEQRTVIEATQRAVTYARAHGVTLVSALGNEHTDLDNPTTDDTSPDFPLGTARERDVDNTCISVPTELDGVIGVTSLGPDWRKADYSNYGTSQADLSAPGGAFRAFVGTSDFRNFKNLILSTYPTAVAEAEGHLDADGNPTDGSTIRECDADGVCATYLYLQGTSMASPHVAGVAALVVSQLGHPDPVHGGLTLDPAIVERALLASATNVPCPGPTLSYEAAGRDESYTASCVGDVERNSIYGEGVVNALWALDYVVEG